MLNILVVYAKFKVERPATILYRCDGKHSPTNKTVVAVAQKETSQPVAVVPKVSPVVGLNGDVHGELKEAVSDYVSGIADGVPILQSGNGRYYKRGDLTRWGRILWIGADFFTTDKCMVKLQALGEKLAFGGEK